MRPLIIAHRGMPRVHPENSLAGFAAALALGVDGIELDVQVTADGVPVVHHDPELGRPAVAVAPLRGRAIADLPLADVRTHELAPGVGVPTLEEVLDVVNGAATVFVEVKARAAESAVETMLSTRATWTAVHSFDHRVPHRAARSNAAISVGILSSSYLLDNVAQLETVGARDLWQHWAMIDAALVDAVHASHRRIIAWTANDPAAIVALARLGVDGICSDVPDVVRTVLDAERAAR